MDGITGYGHVAIKVKDLDRSLAFYTGVLGFPEMLRLKDDAGNPWLICLRITDEQFLEVFPGAEGDQAPGREANCITHICLTVANLEAVVGAIEAKGVTLSRPIKKAIDNNRQAWVEDPDGNRIELMEMADDSLQYEAIRRLARERAPA